MKKLLPLIFSLFFLSSQSIFADDISDFSIEGISIGDSLLDYMTEDEILEEIELNKDMYHWLKEPYKYSEVYLWKDFPIYDFLSFKLENKSLSKYVGKNNNKYIILNLRGVIKYIEDFDSCIQKRDEIAAVLSEMFPNAYKKKDLMIHPSDPSGNSIVDGIYFTLISGEGASVACNDYDETFRNKK